MLFDHIFGWRLSPLLIFELNLDVFLCVLCDVAFLFDLMDFSKYSKWVIPMSYDS